MKSIIYTESIFRFNIWLGRAFYGRSSGGMGGEIVRLIPFDIVRQILVPNTFKACLIYNKKECIYNLFYQCLKAKLVKSIWAEKKIISYMLKNRFYLFNWTSLITKVTFFSRPREYFPPYINQENDHHTK